MDDRLLIALISAGVSIITTLIIKPFTDRKFLIFQLKHQHGAEQAKLVKNHISKHKGRLLKATESLRNRLNNIATNHSKNWLTAKDGKYAQSGYYLDSTVFRFLRFFHALQLLENDLVYLDATNSTKSDKRILKHFRIAKDIMCDTDLFDGFKYDAEHDTDHFFSTLLEDINDSFPKDRLIEYNDFEKLKPTYSQKLVPVYQFFDGITVVETRLRLERLKILHLFLIGFLNEYGYDFHKTKRQEISELKNSLGEFKLLGNYKKLRAKYKLEKLYWLLPQMEIYAVRSH